MTFDDFWALYPRKTNKIKARKAWEKLAPNNFVSDQIAANISDRLRAGEWNEKRFIPHASTYLNNERWEDEIIIQSTAKTRSLLDDLTDRSWAQ